MIGAATAALLALTAGGILVGGLVSVIRLMRRISESMTSVRVLTEAVVAATDQVGDYVSGIGTNVREILDEAQGIAAFVDALPPGRPGLVASDAPSPTLDQSGGQR